MIRDQQRHDDDDDEEEPEAELTVDFSAAVYKAGLNERLVSMTTPILKARTLVDV